MIIISEDGTSAWNFDYIQEIWRNENKLFVITPDGGDCLGEFNTADEAAEALKFLISSITLKTNVIYMRTINAAIRRESKRNADDAENEEVRGETDEK